MAAAADRPSAGGSRARQAYRRVRVQLGSSLQQGAAASRARSCPSVERDAEDRGDQVARHAARPHRRHRRAVLRPVVQPDAVSRSSLVLSRGWPGSRPAADPVCLFGHDSQPLRVAVCAAVDRGHQVQSDERVRDAGILVRPHPERTGGMAGCLSRAIWQRGVVRTESRQP